MLNTQFRSRTARAVASVATVISLAILNTSAAATLEDQVKGLQSSVETVEQRRASAIKDIYTNVLGTYRDSIKIDSVETQVAEVFNRTARIEVTVGYSFDFEKAKAFRANLSRYFGTNTDKEPGVEPYGMVYTNYLDCVGINCTVEKEISRYLKSSAVGIRVTFLGIPGTFPTEEFDGMYDLKPGKMTIQFDVPKSQIKGDPKPTIKAQIFDVHFCPDSPDCNGYRYTIKKG
ncbi:hypothetical protein [Pseudomonas fluorescens]|uniref:Uncharacterized protein n=1 Tax=Pseudomonas fluorescens TaxID=294 RepID=A0A0F4TT64_PSEFL|nr:hypothetical protein [Pseudomonas fluorescens]KJZ47621.1 hypothetical protein VC34_04455 [Pseudomonas fluorescens]